MRGIAIVILAALLAAFGAACMGDDEGEQSRRKAAFGETTPEDPDADPGQEQPGSLLSGYPSRPRLDLSVLLDEKGAAGVSGSVRQGPVSFGQRVSGGDSGIDCATYSLRKTCTWYFKRSFERTVEVELLAFPSAGARVVWTGCSSTAPNSCRALLPDHTNVYAKFVADPKG